MKIGSTLIAFLASFTIPISSWCSIELSLKNYEMGFSLLFFASVLDFLCIKLGYDFLKR